MYTYKSNTIKNKINYIGTQTPTNVQRLLCTIYTGQFLAKYLERGGQTQESWLTLVAPSEAQTRLRHTGV